MRNISRFRMGWLVAISLLTALGGVVLAEGDQTPKLFLPMAVGGQQAAPSCDIPNTKYSTLSISGAPLMNAETNPDLNLGYRGYELVYKPLQLITYDGPPPDSKAPQLPAMFGDNRTPTFTNTYQRYRWIDGNGPIDLHSKWPVTVLGMAVAPGETIYTPNSGYDVGGGNEYVVKYAGPTRITLHIGNEEELSGYVIHIEDVCIDPDLLALYKQLHAAGRNELPALKGHQAIGRALGTEIKVAMRDVGTFMDPRSRNDWWQGR